MLRTDPLRNPLLSVSSDTQRFGPPRRRQGGDSASRFNPSQAQPKCGPGSHDIHAPSGIANPAALFKRSLRLASHSRTYTSDPLRVCGKSRRPRIFCCRLYVIRSPCVYSAGPDTRRISSGNDKSSWTMLLDLCRIYPRIRHSSLSNLYSISGPSLLLADRSFEPVNEIAYVL